MFSFFDMWFHGWPLLKISGIYLIFLLPTFLILKKVKPSFWWMYLFLTIELLLINGVFYWLLFGRGFEEGWEKFLELIFFGAPISAILFLILPIFLKKYTLENKKIKSIAISYLISSFCIYLIGFGLYQLIALSINAWFEYFS